MLDFNFNIADYCAEADECELILSFCELVDTMLKDIQHLKAECVRTRYQLSQHLEPPESEFLQRDILSGLSTPYYDNLAYQIYSAIYYDGGDPQLFKDWCSSLNRLAKGQEDDRY